MALDQQVIAALQAVSTNFVPVISGTLARGTGIWLIGSSIMTFVKASDARNAGDERSSIGRAAGKLLIGALLFQLSWTMSQFSLLLFGVGLPEDSTASANQVLAYMSMPAAVTGFWRDVIQVCLIWIVLLGWASAFRGILQWHKAASGEGGNQGDPFWKGVWHIIGGAAAINMSGAMNAFFNG